MNGDGFLLLALIYAVAVGVSLLITYLVIRFAVVHAMESLPRRAERARRATAGYHSGTSIVANSRAVIDEPSNMHHRSTPTTDVAGLDTAQLRQTVLSRKNLAGDNLAATDGLLLSYMDEDVDWESIWRTAQRESGVPRFGGGPYWLTTADKQRLVPLSVLAFWGTESRRRIAADPGTHAETLELIKNDPDESVRSAIPRSS